MSSVLATVLPVFGLILIGFFAARSGLVAEASGKGLADFIFMIAMPALLFRTMVTAPPVEGAPLAILAGYYLAAIATWLLASLLGASVLGRPACDLGALSIAAVFGNTVMLGIPLGLSHFGEAAAAPLALVVSIHAPILWLAATLQTEWALSQKGVPIGPRLSALGLDFARNPIVVGVVAGILWRATGLGLAPVPDRIIAMLGAAGIPGALFALGMSLARFEVRGQVGGVALVTGIKLLAFPLMAYVLAFWVLALPPVAGGVVVLLAACPTGANAFLFASRYERAVGVVSGSVALGTALAAVTISGLLWALG